MVENIILIACGSFNPPTLMHFRMFEIARDHFRDSTKWNVIGGIVSPVHNSYEKSNVQLATAEHRCQMVRLSLLSSDWIRLSNWEAQQSRWSRTREVLQYHQNYINSMLNNGRDSHQSDTNSTRRDDMDALMHRHIAKYRGQKVRIKLLCGADFLESFVNKNLWNDTEVQQILEDHGVVVITRHGCNPKKCIFDSDLLYKHKANITIIDNWIPNEISSTLIRLQLRRNLSVKYLLSDEVISYIQKNSLYGFDLNKITTSKVCQIIKTEEASADIITNTKYQHDKEMDVTDSITKKNERNHQNNRIVSSRKRKLLIRKRLNDKKSRTQPNNSSDSD